jgi:hypothetical protein
VRAARAASKHLRAPTVLIVGSAPAGWRFSERREL